MSILDVTEDQIFQTLGKGKDPNFKPIEKFRPVIEKPKKTYTINQPSKSVTRATRSNQTPVVQLQSPIVQLQSPIVQAIAEPIIPVQSATHENESVKRLTEDIVQLNDRVNGLQKMVKWYIVPQFVAVLVLVLALILKS